MSKTEIWGGTVNFFKMAFYLFQFFTIRENVHFSLFNILHTLVYASF
jgi:hypothetical protein